MTPTLRLPTLTLALLLAGCTLGPDYQRPTTAVPVAYRHAEGWQAAAPRDLEIRGDWWRRYDDPTLDRLMVQLNQRNQSLAQAEATYRQSLALVSQARAALFPTLSSSLGATRSGRGGGSGSNTVIRNSNGTSSTFSSGGTGTISNAYDASLGVSWELDLWGRVRRQVEADRASAQASAAELAATRLSLQTQLATNYLQLRVLDAQQRLLDATVAAYERSLRLTQNQYRAGIVTPADVAQATTQLKSTQADAIDLRYQRAQLENAIAVLVGEVPANFQLAAVKTIPELPPLPSAVPSTLLERRPDIAQAERQVMAANAAIGVAEAAYYPDLTLSASGGYSASQWGNLISTPNRFWSIGPSFALSLFDGGLRRAQVESAEASYDASVAGYRQTVLDGFREVEDYLVQLRTYSDEAGVRQEALDAARRALQLAENQYQAGLIGYLDVVTLQTTALSNERTNLTLLGSRLSASVQLIAALGGGWDGNLTPPAPRRRP